MTTEAATDWDLRLFWGKTTELPERFHPAIYHLYDVGHVARSLLGRRGSARFTRTLGAALGSDAAMLQDWLPFWVALHDIGKLSGAFQRKAPEHMTRLADLGVPFGTDPGKLGHHTLVGSIWLKGFWPRMAAGDARWQKVVRTAIEGHHGRFPAAGELNGASQRLLSEPAIWQQLRLQGLQALETAFGMASRMPALTIENLTAGAALLTGFTVLCDWIGSDAI